MLHPTQQELTHGEFNKYELTVGISKATRKVTEEYVEERAKAQAKIDSRETDLSLAQLIPEEFRNTKSVHIAIDRMQDGQYSMVRAEEDQD